MTKQKRTCPDCDERMEPIKLLGGEGVCQGVLKYAAPDARRSFLTGRAEPFGTVRARMCPACGRIVLHGEPDQRDS